MTNTNKEPKREWESKFEERFVHLNSSYVDQNRIVMWDSKRDIKEYIKQVEDQAIKRTVMKVREELISEVKIGHIDLSNNKSLEKGFNERKTLAQILLLPSLTIINENNTKSI